MKSLIKSNKMREKGGVMIQEMKNDTVKHGYSKHAFNELTLNYSGVIFISHMTVKNVVNLTDKTNFIYKEVQCKITCPWHFAISVFYCT